MEFTKEVLPPRSAPCDPYDFGHEATRQGVTEAKDFREALNQSIWTVLIIAGLLSLVWRLLETWS